MIFLIVHLLVMTFLSINSRMTFLIVRRLVRMNFSFRQL